MLLHRGLSICFVVLVAFGAVFLREATSPSGSGYWAAVAAAPGGGLYVADEARSELLRVVDGSPDTVVGKLPKAIYRALAAEGRTLLLATQSGLFVSLDGGGSWTLKIGGGRRFTAVALRGRDALGGVWNDALWRSQDGGENWESVSVPAGNTEFESLAITDHAFLAATLLGLMVSTDGGSTWSTAKGVGNRTTALDGLQAGDWWGNTYSSGDGVTWARSGHLPGGVWSLSGDLAGTTSGLYRAGAPTRGIGSREITKVVSSPPRYYATVARGPIYVSDSGLDWRLSGKG